MISLLRPSLVAAFLSFLIAGSLFAQAPANDNFADRILLSGALPITTAGTNVAATGEILEPDHAATTGMNQTSNSVWWQWTADFTGAASFVVSDASFDLAIGVYSGDTLAGLTEVGYADNFFVGGEAAAANVTAGVTYSIAVDGYSTGGVGESGTFSLAIDALTAPANNDFADAEVLSGLPDSAAGQTTGADAEFGEPDHTTTAFGNVSSNTVWYIWTAPSNGQMIAAASGINLDLAISVYTGNSLGGLALVAETDDGGASVIERASFFAAAGTTYRIAVDQYTVDSLPVVGGPFRVFVSASPLNDSFSAAQDIGNSLPAGPVEGSNLGATAEAGEPEHSNFSGGNLASSSVWYSWTAPADALVAFEAGNAFGWDAVVGVYTGDVVGGLTEVGAADRWVDDFTERAVVEVEAGTTYRIAVDAWTDNTGRASFREGLFDLRVIEVPPNDDFVNATDLFDLALPLTRMGTTVNASSEFGAGEPDHASFLSGNFSSNSVWYRWTASSDGMVEITVSNPTFDSVLAVYIGGSLASLGVVAEADALGVGGSETLSIDVSSGTEYIIVVDVFSGFGLDSGGGEFTLTMNSGGVVSPYDTWIAGFPSLTGDDALPEGNPSGDGISNLLKLVMGLNPTINSSVDPNRANLPQLVTYQGNPALQYTVVEANLGSGAGAITHGGEYSEDLTDWSPGPAINTGGNVWLIPIPPVGGDDARYARLAASIP